MKPEQRHFSVQKQKQKTNYNNKTKWKREKQSENNHKSVAHFWECERNMKRTTKKWYTLCNYGKLHMNIPTHSYIQTNTCKCISIIQNNIITTTNTTRNYVINLSEIYTSTKQIPAQKANRKWRAVLHVFFALLKCFRFFLKRLEGDIFV